MNFTALLSFPVPDFLKMLPESTKDKFKAWSDSFGWEQAAAEYGKRMQQLYGTTRILGKSAPVRLEGIFTDVYILDRPSAFERFDILTLRKDPETLACCERRDGLEVVEQIGNNRLFILGKPGAGKTTFLKYVTLQAIQGKLKKIPIFVSLKEWADSGLELDAFLEQQFEICQFPEAKHFIEYILKQGHALVLFDGLDEVQQADNQRQKMTLALQNFSRQYLLTQCLITCRIAATDYSFEQFTYMEMADFSDEQMRTFVEKWFCDDEIKLQKFLEGFEKDEHQNLRELGNTPLLLSLLCLNFEETMQFPPRRVEIYEEAIDALLKKWDSSRSIVRDEIYHRLSIGRKRQLFSRIAAQTFNNNDYFIEQKRLEKQIVDYIKQLPEAEQAIDIDGEQLLKAIEAQHGIFVERARQIYSFSHLTFQEYFTAKSTVENKRYVQLIQDKKLEGRYREVFLLTASMLDDADEFFEIFLQENGRIVSKHKKLIQFLDWANQKALLAKTNEKIADNRFFYIFLANANANANANAIAKAYTNTYAIAIAKAIANAIANANANANAIAIAKRLPYVLRVDYLLFITLLISQVFLFTAKNNKKQAIDKILTFKDFFKQVLEECNDSKLLYEKLNKLVLPTKTSGYEEWEIFTQQLRQIMQQERDIGHEWDFSKEEIECLGDYFKANKLLSDCLKLATVSDRQSIEDRLFLPLE